MRKKGILLCAFSAMSFGFVPLFTKVVMQEGLDVVAIGFFRFLGLGLFSLGMIRLQKRPFSIEIKRFPAIVADSFFQVVTMLLLSASYLFIPTGNATSLHFMYPVFVFLILYLYYKNRFSGMQWLALVLCASGIVCFIDFDNMNNWIGMGIAIASGLTYAIYMVILDKQGLAQIDPFVLSFIGCVLETVFLAILGLGMGSFHLSLNASGVLSLVILAGLSVCGTLLLQVGTRYIGSGMASLFCLFEPLTSLICGWMILKDPLRWGSVLGCLLIFGGILLILKPPKRSQMKKIKWIKK
ncbi:DMT family transporter [Faecalicoccus acidiformans]|uniref:DMT family transporter n=1 Tax=Faecalicoccus acidiformans TaxID=915173 RepID=UPI0025A3AABB|nr:DMT family transporter [Faecalicoccus acidiformans]MDM8202866.1 DMT family transporter [Faecalicoccus acidiformans]